MPIFIDEHDRQRRPGVRIAGQKLDGALERDARQEVVLRAAPLLG